MATGFGTSFDMSKLGKELDRLEKQLEGIVKKGENAKQAIEQMLLSNNANNFLNKIEKIKKNFIDLSSIKDPMKWDSTKLKGYIDQVNRLLRTVNQINSVNGGENQLINTKQLEKAKKEFKSLLTEVKSLEKAQGERSTSRNQTYSGALRYSANVKNLEQEKKAVINLEAARDKLKKSDADYATKLNALNLAIQKHEQNLRNATKTDQQRAEEARKASEKIVEAHRRERAEYERRKTSTMDKWYSSSPSRALKSYNSLMGDNGVFNLNNAQKVISHLEQAQAKVNLRTQEGQRAYATLGNAINAVRGRMREYGAQTDALRNKHQGLMDISGQLARRLALVFSVSQITNYARKIIDVRRQFELQHRSLQILIQDQDKANDIWNQTVALALKSPFRVKELVTYTKQLAAYRIETEKLHDTTKMLADVSAGLGVDMNRLILAFGQIKAANFLRGTELRQLTEAGIPMLDELAKHFNDMNKTALTSADVFEMISKRMVTFKDVEAVFKRITSEGGVFYKMQEQQAETLHGMISNLGDSFDLMMNSIGQANDGIMKDTISSIKTIVDNWRVFAEILKQVAVLLASIKVAQFANAWRVASGSIASATIASEGMALTCSKLRRTLISLKTTMMGHPLLLIGTLVASGISALMAYNDAIDETNKKYDEASTKELRKRDNLLKINKEVEKNNAVLKDSTKSEQELEKARKANENQLKLLKNDYPQINNYIKIQKDGTIDLTRAIEEQNAVLRANILLQQASKRSAFQQDLSTNYVQSLEAWTKYEAQIIKVNVLAEHMRAQIEARKDDFTEDPEKYAEYLKLYKDMSTADSVDSILSLRNQIAALGPQKDVRIPKQLYSDLLTEIQNTSASAHDYLKALDDLYDNLDNGMSTFIVNIQRLYDEFGKNANSDKFKKQGGKFITDALKNLGITDERTLKEAQKYIQQEVSKALNIKLNLDFSVDKGQGDGQLADWAKRIKPAVEKFNAEIKKLHPELEANRLFPVPDADMTWEQYENLSKGIIEIGERTYQKGQKIFGKLDIEQTEALKPFIKEYKNLLNIEDKNKKDESDQTLDYFKRLVELLKQVKKEYDDVSKKRGTAEGKLQAFASKQIVFDEIMSKLPKEFSGKIKLTDFDVTTETGMIDFLLKMLRELPDTEQKARLALKKFIDELQFEESNELAEKTNQQIIDSIDKQIGQYEVSLEIKEMGVPADFAKRIFGLDAGSLDITDIINNIRTRLADANAKGMTDLATELEKKLKQAENILIKRNRDELDRFVEYYKESMDKIKVIQDKGEMDLSLAKGFLDIGAINTEEYVAIVKTIVDRVNSEISNVKIDKFKQSELYIKVMGDVAAYTNEELKDMIRTLNEIIAKQGHVMKSQELREYEKAIKKIQEQIQKNDDNKLFRDENWSNIKEILALEEKITQEKEKQAQLEGQIKFEEQQLNAQQGILANELAKPIEQQDNSIINAAQSGIDESITNLTKLKDTYNGISTSISEMGGEMSNLTNGLGSSLGVVDKIIKGIYQGINASIQIFNHVKELADSMGTDVDSGKWNRAQEIFKTIGDVNNEAMAVWESLKSGDIAGAIAHTVGSITKLWAGINRIYDTKHENRIIEAKKQVELLERQYRKLEDAINDAFTFDAMKNSYGQALDNLQKQKAQYMEMLDAERDKKNEDKEAIAEYEDKIYDLERSMKEMQEEKIEKFGGTTDYWGTAEDFTNAWLDAFKETGNGLKGLEENMDEFLRNVAIKQVIGQKVGQLTKDFADIINPRLEDGKIDETEGVEIENARERFINALNTYMQGLMGSTLGDWLFDETNSTLSGLSQGIQGVTEETAQIIEAYLNSIRFMIADNNSMWKRYIDIQLSDTDETANPILSELKAHTTLITEIRNMFSSVIQNGKETPLGGQFLKVVMG